MLKKKTKEGRRVREKEGNWGERGPGSRPPGLWSQITSPMHGIDEAKDARKLAWQCCYSLAAYSGQTNEINDVVVPVGSAVSPPALR